MKRSLRHLFLVVALLFSQQAAQVHALSHLGRDLARTEGSGKNLPPLGHPAELCIAFHAVDSALLNALPACDAPRIALQDRIDFALPLPISARIAFDSRAPPVSA